LTGLRFLAASAIVLHHLRGSFGFPYIDWPLGNAVSFFFVLSGFILAHVYGQIEDSAGLQRFWRARFARIWPLHAVTFAFAWAVLDPGFPAAPWVANAFLVQSWIPIQEFYFSYNAVSWSISTEVFLYLAFPLLLFRLSRTWHWKLALAFLLVLIMAMLARGVNDASPDAISRAPALSPSALSPMSSNSRSA